VIAYVVKAFLFFLLLMGVSVISFVVVMYAIGRYCNVFISHDSVLARLVRWLQRVE